jgi:hypothetical protein
MRLLIAIAAAALPLSAAPAQRTFPAPAERDGVPLRPCGNPLVHHADNHHKGKASRLGELPPGDLILSVLRGSDGCFKPVIVRQGFGAAGGEPQSAPPRVEPPRRPRLIR